MKPKKPDKLLDKETGIPRAILCERSVSLNIQGTLEPANLTYLAQWMLLAAAWIENNNKKRKP